MKKIKIGLLPRIIIAIILGIAIGTIFPAPLVRIFVTFNGIFSEFLNFSIPLIIVGLVTVAIADIGKGAGKMLLVTALIAYGATLFSGFLSYFTGVTVFPSLIEVGVPLEEVSEAHGILPYFSVSIPPLMNVMTALILAFTLGLGLAALHSDALKSVARDFQEIIVRMISAVILPLLPLYIFGIFLNMTHSGQVYAILMVFIKIIGVIFLLHIFLLVFQYSIAALFVRKNPFRLLGRMMPAYFIGHAIVRRHHSGDAGADEEERSIRRHCRIRDSALRHHSPVRQHAENRGLRTGTDDDARNAVRLPAVCRIHLYAGHHDGSCTGRSGRSHHGGTRYPAIDARLRRVGTGADDRTLHRHGQFRDCLQRDGRRSHRVDHRQSNGKRNGKIKQTWFAYTA